MTDREIRFVPADDDSTEILIQRSVVDSRGAFVSLNKGDAAAWLSPTETATVRDALTNLLEGREVDEPAPEAPAADTLAAGTRVRILDRPFFRAGGGEYLQEGALARKLGTITDGPDTDGDYTVDVDGVRAAAIAPECLELAPEPLKVGDAADERMLALPIGSRVSSSVGVDGDFWEREEGGWRASFGRRGMEQDPGFGGRTILRIGPALPEPLKVGDFAKTLTDGSNVETPFGFSHRHYAGVGATVKIIGSSAYGSETLTVEIVDLGEGFGSSGGAELGGGLVKVGTTQTIRRSDLERVDGPPKERVFGKGFDLTAEGFEIQQYGACPCGTWKTSLCEALGVDPTDFATPAKLPEPEPAPLARREEGSKAVATGADSGRWGHRLAAGTVVTIETDDVDLDGSYYVQPAGVYIDQHDLADFVEPEKPTFKVGDRVVRNAEPHKFYGAFGPIRRTANPAPESTVGTVSATHDDGDLAVRWESSFAQPFIRPEAVDPAPVPVPPLPEPLKEGDCVVAPKMLRTQTGGFILAGTRGKIVVLGGYPTTSSAGAWVGSQRWANVAWERSGSYTQTMLLSDLEKSTEPKALRALQTGDRVVRVSEEHTWDGDSYGNTECSKGSIGTVTGAGYTRGTWHVSWDGGRGSVIDADNLVAFEALTEALPVGTKVVFLENGHEPLFSKGEVVEVRRSNVGSNLIAKRTGGTGRHATRFGRVLS